MQARPRRAVRGRAAAQGADHRCDRDLLPAPDARRHRLIRRDDPVSVLDRHGSPSRHRAGEAHRSLVDREHLGPGPRQVDAPMTGRIGPGGLLEAVDQCMRRRERPLPRRPLLTSTLECDEPRPRCRGPRPGRCRTARRGQGACRHGEHGQQRRRQHPQASPRVRPAPLDDLLVDLRVELLHGRTPPRAAFACHAKAPRGGRMRRGEEREEARLSPRPTASWSGPRSVRLHGASGMPG